MTKKCQGGSHLEPDHAIHTVNGPQKVTELFMPSRTKKNKERKKLSSIKQTQFNKATQTSKKHTSVPP